MRNRPLSNRSTRLAELSPGPPCRAVSPAHSRKLAGSTAPEVPSTVGPPGCPESGYPSPAGTPTTLWQPSAFVSSPKDNPDEAVFSVARPSRRRKNNRPPTSSPSFGSQRVCTSSALLTSSPDGATVRSHKERSRINRSSRSSLSFRLWVCRPVTRTHVRLLGSCYKTSR
jgi:hypothetical protein